MSDVVTITGLVATEPRYIQTQDGLAITSFRLASMNRRFDRSTNEWRDDGTNWYSVSAFRGLATNTHRSVSKGHRVIVSGRLKVREWDTGEKSGISVDIEADSIGHDLLFGQTTYERNRLPESRDGDQKDPADDELLDEDSEDTF
jgi:single-strand DNA-binding protein